MNKFISSSLNIILALLLGIFLAAVPSLIVLRLVPKDSFKVLFASIIIVILIIFSTVVTCIVLERKKVNNRLIAFFRGNLVRKTYLLLGTISALVVSINLFSKINLLLYAKYSDFANEISETLQQSIQKGEMVAEINNRLEIDTILITEAYVLNDDVLLNTGLVTRRLAKSMAARNAKSEGVYLHLAKNNHVVAFVRFSSDFGVESPFYLIKPKNKIQFFLKKTNGRYVIYTLK